MSKVLNANNNRAVVDFYNMNKVLCLIFIVSFKGVYQPFILFLPNYTIKKSIDSYLQNQTYYFWKAFSKKNIFFFSFCNVSMIVETKKCIWVQKNILFFKLSKTIVIAEYLPRMFKYQSPRKTQLDLWDDRNLIWLTCTDNAGRQKFFEIFSTKLSNNIQSF